MQTHLVILQKVTFSKLFIILMRNCCDLFLIRRAAVHTWQNNNDVINKYLPEMKSEA